jgi:hypothetical protein
LKTIGVTRKMRVQSWNVNQRVTAAEESSSPTFATRKRLVKALQMKSYYGELLPRED